MLELSSTIPKGNLDFKIPKLDDFTVNLPKLDNDIINQSTLNNNIKKTINS